jgi:hypothetical protein
MVYYKVTIAQINIWVKKLRKDEIFFSFIEKSRRLTRRRIKRGGRRNKEKDN